jgi:hypothetical protein
VEGAVDRPKFCDQARASVQKTFDGICCVFLGSAQFDARDSFPLFHSGQHLDHRRIMFPVGGEFRDSKFVLAGSCLKDLGAQNDLSDDLGNGVPRLAGIYQRVDARSARPMIIFVRAPAYRSRYPFYDTAQEIVRRNLERHFWEGFDKYVRGGALSAAPAVAA